MTRSRKTLTKKNAPAKLAGYERLFADVAEVIDEARRSTARSVNAVMTATYWLVGRRIVEAEQAGETKAEYGKEIVDRLSADLTGRFGRGFGRRNLFQMRTFYLAYRDIVQTPSAQFGTIPVLSENSTVLKPTRMPWQPKRRGPIRREFRTAQGPCRTS